MLKPLPQEVLKGNLIGTKSLVKKQIKAVRETETEITELAGKGLDSAGTEQLQEIARSLRDFHICIENALGFIAHNYDNGIPQGDNVHHLLLEQMTVERDGSRPPVIDKVLKEDLGKYLEFRLDWEKDPEAAGDKERIASLVEDLKAVSAAARQQLTDFFDELKKYHGWD